MSKPSGFVPIPFHVVGKLLIVIGLAALTSLLIAQLSQWFSMPSKTFLLAFAIILIGLYLIFIVPRE